MGLFSNISGSVKKLFARDGFNLDDFTKQELVTKKKKVGHRVREFEQRADKAEKETDRLINEAIDSGGSESKMKRAIRRAKSNKKKMNFYNNIADRLLLLSDFFDELIMAKEGKRTVANVDQLIKNVAGSNLEELKDQATLSLIETDSFLENIETTEAAGELTPIMNKSQKEGDEELAREVEREIDEEIIEGKTEENREDILARIKEQL